MFKWTVFAPARPAAYALAVGIDWRARRRWDRYVFGRGGKEGRTKSAKGPRTPPKAAAEAGAAGAEAPQLIFSPWTKFCLKGQEAQAKQVCFTGKDGRVESGMPVVAAVLIEPEGEPRKILRVTLPLGMSLQPGTRVIIDQGQPMTGPYVICFNNGCMADYEASDELIGNHEERPGPGGAGHQRRRPADQPGAAAQRFRQGL